jgi:hypothetical protein
MLREGHGGYPTYWPCGVRCIGGVILIRAFVQNLRTCPAMLREKAQAAKTVRLKVPMRRPRAGSAEPGVMLGERRGWVIEVEIGSTGDRKSLMS